MRVEFLIYVSVKITAFWYVRQYSRAPTYQTTRSHIPYDGNLNQMVKDKFVPVFN
jgi:hypothetical protein